MFPKRLKICSWAVYIFHLLNFWVEKFLKGKAKLAEQWFLNIVKSRWVEKHFKISHLLVTSREHTSIYFQARNTAGLKSLIFIVSVVINANLMICNIKYFYLKWNYSLDSKQKRVWEGIQKLKAVFQAFHMDLPPGQFTLIYRNCNLIHLLIKEIFVEYLFW